MKQNNLENIYNGIEMIERNINKIYPLIICYSFSFGFIAIGITFLFLLRDVSFGQLFLVLSICIGFILLGLYCLLLSIKLTIGYRLDKW